MVTICTASLTFSNTTFCPHSVFMCFVCISEQTAIISLYNINWLVCIAETECVYCAVRTGYITLRCHQLFTKTPYPFHRHDSVNRTKHLISGNFKERVFLLKSCNIEQRISPAAFVCKQSVSNSITVGVFTCDRWNKSDTTRACIIYLRGVAFKRLHVSAFLHLGHHQVVSSLPRKLYYIYVYIQSLIGGTDQTSVGCSLGHTIPIQPKTPISKVQWLRRYWPEKFETLTVITHLLITKYILKLARICGFCSVNICT